MTRRAIRHERDMNFPTQIFASVIMFHTQTICATSRPKSLNDVELCGSIVQEIRARQDLATSRGKQLFEVNRAVSYGR
jgi:hypothetical protein